MIHQEIDRLFDEYYTCRDEKYMEREDFHAAISVVAAEVRRQSLEEAAMLCANLEAERARSMQSGAAYGARQCAKRIRALAQSEREEDK